MQSINRREKTSQVTFSQKRLATENRHEVNDRQTDKIEINRCNDTKGMDIQS